jgi:hypothetical protein
MGHPYPPQSINPTGSGGLVELLKRGAMAGPTCQQTKAVVNGAGGLLSVEL